MLLVRVYDDEIVCRHRFSKIMLFLVTKAPDEWIYGDVELQDFITNRNEIKWYVIFSGFKVSSTRLSIISRLFIDNLCV